MTGAFGLGHKTKNPMNAIPSEALHHPRRFDGQVDSERVSSPACFVFGLEIFLKPKTWRP